MNIRKIRMVTSIVLVTTLAVLGIVFKSTYNLTIATLWIYIFLLDDKVEMLEEKLESIRWVK